MSGRRNTSSKKRFATSVVDWMTQGVVRTTAAIIPTIERRKTSERGVCLYPPLGQDAACSMPWRMTARVNDATLGRTTSAAAVVTPSLNGLLWPVGPGVPTKADVDAIGDKRSQGLALARVLNAMEEQYPIAGKVEDYKNVLESSTTTTLAVQTAGTMSLPNTSGQVLVIGSAVQFRLPVPDTYAGLVVPGHPPLMNPKRGMAGIASYQIYCPSKDEMFEPGHVMVEKSAELDLETGGDNAYVEGVLGMALRVLVPLMRAGIIKWGNAPVGGHGVHGRAKSVFGQTAGASALTTNGVKGVLEATAATASAPGSRNVAGLDLLCGPKSKETPAGLSARKAIAKLLLDGSSAKLLTGDPNSSPASREAMDRFTKNASGCAAAGYAKSTNPAGRMDATVIASAGVESSVRLQVQ